MLSFKKITLSDLTTYKSLSKNTAELSCETTFVNLLLWADGYNNEIAVSDGQLFIKNGEKAELSFRLPVGGDLKEGVEKLTAYLGKRPVFWSEECSLFDKFRLLYEDEYAIFESRDDFEYIYSQQALSELSGKKHHSKRNHINAFAKKYAFKVTDLSTRNLDDVLNCADKWYASRNIADNKYLACERDGIKQIILNMDKLSAKGIAIYVNDEMVAFAIGSPISDIVFNIHIEKALDEFQGAYAVINQEFAKMLSGYKYINREDDMGIEGLRKAKLSYKPEILLKKYLCVPKTEILAQCRNIYREAFGIEEDFEQALFTNCKEHLKYLEVNGEVVSILFLLPCELQNKPAYYLFAAATKKDCRKNGYMSRLINSVIDDTPIFLRPVNETLVPFYESLGFTVINACDTNGDISLLPKGYFETLYSFKETENKNFLFMAKNYKTDKKIYFDLSLN